MPVEFWNVFYVVYGMHDLVSVPEVEMIYYYRFYFQPRVFVVLLTWTRIGVTVVCMHIQCSVTFNLYCVSCLVITPENQFWTLKAFLNINILYVNTYLNIAIDAGVTVVNVHNIAKNSSTTNRM